MPNPKRLMLLPVVALALGWAVIGNPQAVVRAQSTAVTIHNFSFAPNPITVPAGTTVAWRNLDTAPHSATADDNAWTTPVLQNGQTGSVTFTTPGTFTYHCKIHPNMHGTVIVTAVSAAPTATTAPPATAVPTIAPAPTATVAAPVATATTGATALATASVPLAAYPVLPRLIAVQRTPAGLRIVPATAVVRPGQAVTWRNDLRGTLTLVGRAGWSFTSPRLRHGQKAGVVLAAPGVYQYSVRHRPGLSGTIIVRRA